MAFNIPRGEGVGKLPGLTPLMPMPVVCFCWRSTPGVQELCCGGVAGKVSETLESEAATIRSIMMMMMLMLMLMMMMMMMMLVVVVVVVVISLSTVAHLWIFQYVIV